MSSINDAVRMIYGDWVSDEYEMLLISQIGSTSRSGNVENRNIVTTTNMLGNYFNFHGVKYDQPLEFDLLLVNSDGGTYIDNYKERALKKGLMKNKRQWLSIDQTGLENISFYCICNSCELVDVGMRTAALKCNFVCDAPWAWSELKRKEYTTVSNTLSFKLSPYFDFDEYVCLPNLTVQSLGSGTISIANNTTSETLSFTGCTTGEIIKYETQSDKISSTATNIISRWNKKGISIVENDNNFVLTGNFKLTVEYRLPVRVGA
jgi:hypothetical protein